MQARSSTLGRLRVRLRRLFYGHRPAAVAFPAGLLAIDLAAIAYFVATTFVADATWLRVVDLLLGVLLALEFLGRMLAHRHPMAYLDNGAALVDLVVIASLFVSALGGNLGFLRSCARSGCSDPTTCSASSRGASPRCAGTRR